MPSLQESVWRLESCEHDNAVLIAPGTAPDSLTHGLFRDGLSWGASIWIYGYGRNASDPQTVASDRYPPDQKEEEEEEEEEEKEKRKKRKKRKNKKRKKKKKKTRSFIINNKILFKVKYNRLFKY